MYYPRSFLKFILLGFLLVSLALALLCAPSTLYASGFRILDQSASATGQASAFTAQADDASAVYYNPAGMTQLRGVQVSLGANLIGGSTNFRDAAGQTAHHHDQKTKRTDQHGNALAHPAHLMQHGL